MVTDPSHPTHAGIPGITLEDDGRLGSDLACWSCQYNLRSLEIDAACPECGSPVSITLEHMEGRKHRPFSLYTIHPIMRVLGLIYGLIGPALIVIIAASAPMDPINVEWQSGEIRDYIGLMLAGRVMWAFYPFLIWCYAAYGSLMLAPLTAGRRGWVRAGLWLGCILGAQYQLIIGGNLLGLSLEFAAAIVVGFIPITIIAAIAWRYWASDATRVPKPHRKRSARSITAFVFATVVVLTILGILSGGVVFVPIFAPILFAGPYLMLICMGAALCRLYRTDFDQPAEPAKPIPVATACASYAAAWPIAISQAQIVYSSLPISPPSCYITTASAYGHPWLTRAKPVQFPNGQVVMVTKQMQTLKAAEHVLERYLPSEHRALRKIYDKIGPAIARRIRSHWLADLSFILFSPIAALAWLVILLMGRTSDIKRACHR